jgi:hypothetical protein
MAMQYSELHEENKALCETGLKTRIERLLHLLGKSKQCLGIAFKTSQTRHRAIQNEGIRSAI